MEEEYYRLREYKKRMFRKKIRSVISHVLMLAYSFAWFYMLGSICPVIQYLSTYKNYAFYSPATFLPFPITPEGVVATFIISPLFGIPIIIYYKWKHIKILRRMRTVWISGNKYYMQIPCLYHVSTAMIVACIGYIAYLSHDPIYKVFLTIFNGTLVMFLKAVYLPTIIAIIFPQVPTIIVAMSFFAIVIILIILLMYPYHAVLLVDAVAGWAGMPIRKLIGIRQTNYPTETIGFRDVFKPEKFPDPAAEPEHQPQSEPQPEPQAGSDQEPELSVEEGMGGSEGGFGGEGEKRAGGVWEGGDAEKAGAEGGGIAGSAGPIGTTERGSIERAGSSGGGAPAEAKRKRRRSCWGGTEAAS